MKTRFLAVDDEPDVLKLLESLLESLGCEVHAFSDSREAVGQVDHQKYDAAFLDARMPHMDGFELTRRIRSSPSNSRIPVVMLTDSQDLATMREAVRAGITFFVGKPFDVRRLRGLLDAISGHMLAEKRHYPRLPWLTLVDCRAENKYQFKSSSVNISEGGMLLESSGGLEVGRELDLQFNLPGVPEGLNPRAKVVGREPPDRMAVQFLLKSAQDQDSLRRFIQGSSEDEGPIWIRRAS
jgi:CheY-like chemotaxis protein